MKHFGLILTLFSVSTTCFAQKVVTEIHARQIKVDSTTQAVQKIEKLISPYSVKINNELDKVLAFNPTVLDKSRGVTAYQSKIGDLFAKVIFDKSNKVLIQRENKAASMAIFNHGGIRGVLPAGNITKRNAFEIMPFENSGVVLEVKGQIILDFVNYFIKEGKPHPIYALTFTIDKDNMPIDIKVGNKPLDLNATYYIATNDYLASGGDKMDFLLKASNKYVLNYKLRDMLIDYFIDVDTVIVPEIVKVIKE